jgi:hypothetical protein
MQGRGHQVASLPLPSFSRSRREAVPPAAGCSRPPQEVVHCMRPTRSGERRTRVCALCVGAGTTRE